jgi:predicted AAA+ superfamily ATPase
MFSRPANATLLARLREPRRFMQVVIGPRQVGKTTAVRQVLDALDLPRHYATADTATLQSRAWLDEQWGEARLLAMQASRPVVLAIDEIQKVPAWSSTTKQLWDEDAFERRDIRVVLTGSSPLLMQQGLSESLTGRFEIVPMTHWTWPECRDAFGWDLDTYVFHGGYPGAAPLIGDFERWRSYILDAIVETTVSRDILLMTRVDKPALLRRVFHLACEYAGRELTFEKIVGRLQDVGNTTTVAHYLDLLDSAGLVAALQKYAGDIARRRRSTPKLAVHNTALMTAVAGMPLAETRADGRAWGRLVEAVVGAHLLAHARRARMGVYYWRTKVGGEDVEVDYVTSRGRDVTAIEVKSGTGTGALAGLVTFKAQFGPRVKAVLVGPGGVSLEEFLSQEP